VVAMSPRVEEVHDRRLALVRRVALTGPLTPPALARERSISIASSRAILASAERAGLLVGERPLSGAPPLFVATARGLRAASLSGYRRERVSPARAPHLIAVAEATGALSRCYPGWRIQGEQDLRRCERLQRSAVASASMPAPAGERSLHRPDLVLWPSTTSSRQLPLPVEVELTVKAPRRLREICRAWARCRHVAGVLYLVSELARPAVERAVTSERAERAIVLLDLDTLIEESPIAVAP